MSVRRKLGELQAECQRLGLQPAPTTRSKPGKAEYVKALEQYYLNKYEKENFASTVIANEGLWQRLNLLFMFIPLCIVCLQEI